MFKAKRLHPIGAVLNTIKYLKELILPFAAFFFFGTKGSNWSLLYILGYVSVLVVLLVTGVVTWLRFTYRIEEGELRIESGIFVRKKRYIPFERIQSLDSSEGLLHRPFGLVKMKVETAGANGGQEAEAVLTAISKADAASIQEILAIAKNKVKKMDVNTEEVESTFNIYKISPGELLLLGSTSGGVGVVLSAVFAFLSQLEEFIPYQKIFKGFEKMAANGLLMISILAMIGFILAWAIALLGTMLKYANFTVQRKEEDLIISSGLLEKRQITIPLHRIQSIRIHENFLRQLFGFATVFVDHAGGSVMDDDSSRVMILPFIKKERIAHLIGSHFKDYHLDVAFGGAPKRSLQRYITRSCLFVLPVVIATILLFRPWGYLSLLLLLPTCFWAYLKYKDAGWSLGENQLSLRYRNIIRTTVFMQKNKIQSMDVRVSFFQEKKGLSSLHAVVKSGAGGSGGTVIDLEKKEIYEVYQWYSQKS